MFAYAKWIIKCTSPSAVICVIHANTSLSGRIKAPGMQAYGASFITAAEDVLRNTWLISGDTNEQTYL